MILCDTNILIEFYKNNSQVISEHNPAQNYKIIY